MLNGVETLVYSGADANNPQQGLVIVVSVPNYPGTTSGTRVLTAGQYGQLTMTVAGNNRLGLLSSSGATLVFDLESGSFVQTVVAADTTGPTCALTGTGTNAQGQKYLQITIQDTGSGLGAVQITELNNAAANWDDTAKTAIAFGGFAPVLIGDSAAHVVTATKLDQSQAAQVAMQVTDVAGNITNCDPILTEVGREPGVARRATFHHVARAESRVYVYNSAPGLTHLLLIVNGKQFEVAELEDSEVREVNVASAMRPGNNTITLEALGRPGGSATVLIADM